jgi:putative spermidine/putrescine transport system permease protein
MSAALVQAAAGARAPRLTLLGLYTTLVCVFLIGPLAVVFLSSLSSAEYVSFPPVGLSPRWYVEMFRNSEFTDSLLISLRIAAIVALLSCVIGVLAALAMTRLEFRGRWLLNALFLSPLVVPGIVLGAAVLQFYARTGMTSSTTSLVLGHLAIATPYMIRLTTASLVGFDTRLELAARNLGATPFTAFRRITLPIVMPGISAGIAFAFIVSFEDVNLALFLAGPQSITLPVRIFGYMTQESSPIIGAAGSLLALIVLVMAFVIDRLVGLRRAFGA